MGIGSLAKVTHLSWKKRKKREGKGDEIHVLHEMAMFKFYRGSCSDQETTSLVPLSKDIKYKRDSLFFFNLLKFPKIQSQSQLTLSQTDFFQKIQKQHSIGEEVLPLDQELQGGGVPATPSPGGREWMPWLILALLPLLPVSPTPQHGGSYVTIDRTTKERCGKSW